MTFRMALVVSLIVCFSPAKATCQSDAYTEVGVSHCVLPSGCEQVFFDPPFSSIPHVALSVAEIEHNSGNSNPILVSQKVKALHLDQGGFTPQLCATYYVGSDQPQPNLTNCNLIGAVHWVAVGKLAVDATAVPKFVVLTVIYAPPGSGGSLDPSSVSYSVGSSTGTTSGTKKSFKQTYSVSRDVKAGNNIGGVGGSAYFEYSNSTTDSDSVEIRKTSVAELDLTGQKMYDGINHDYDEIYIWLNPSVALKATPTSVAWSFSENQASIPAVQWFYAGELIPGHLTMRPPMQTVVDNFHLTPDDFKEIVKSDPPAQGEALDPRRYLLMKTPYVYEPPNDVNGHISPYKETLSTSDVSTVGTEVINDTKTSVTVTMNTGAADVVSGQLNISNTWDWTNTSSQSTETGTTESAQVVFGGPSYAYPKDKGTAIRVYYDTMFKTFAFDVVVLTPTFTGTLKMPDGKTAPIGTPVTLIANGERYNTVTNAEGKFKLYDNIVGPAVIEANGVTQKVVGLQPPRVPNVLIQLH